MKTILGWILAWGFSLLFIGALGFHVGQNVDTIKVQMPKDGGRVIVKVLPLLPDDKRVVVAGAGDQGYRRETICV